MRWLGSRKGPGVLVLGQPLFGEVGRSIRMGPDLPEYRRQFGDLSRALLEAPCSTLILSGDLHWGRVAHGVTARKQRLVEVISSPLRLSAPRKATQLLRPWRRALPRFPEGSGPLIRTKASSRLYKPHFVTLEFRLRPDDGGVQVEIHPQVLSPGAARRPAYNFDL
jgi:hypothetical protein